MVTLIKAFGPLRRFLTKSSNGIGSVGNSWTEGVQELGPGSELTPDSDDDWNCHTFAKSLHHRGFYVGVSECKATVLTQDERDRTVDATCAS